MATIQIFGQPYEIELAVFDKDGTLVDFHLLWGQLHRQWVAALIREAQLKASLAEQLHRALGYDWQYDVVIADGPLAIASNRELETLAAGVLFRNGLNWTEANLAVARSRQNGGAPWPEADIVRPLGEVRETMAALQAAGVKIAVATSDDRAPTVETMALMGLTELVDMLACGDDPLPHKPDPAGFHHICQTLGIPPERALMAGDTVNDILFGQNAGAALTLGILGGAGNETDLEKRADLVARSIDVIRPASRN